MAQGHRPLHDAGEASKWLQLYSPHHSRGAGGERSSFVEARTAVCCARDVSKGLLQGTCYTDQVPR